MTVLDTVRSAVLYERHALPFITGDVCESMSGVCCGVIFDKR